MARKSDGLWNDIKRDFIKMKRIQHQRAWSDEGEPREPPEGPRRPAVFYAPPGECDYCDRRRAAAARSMRGVRERGKGE